jgi:hypothetical protein
MKACLKLRSVLAIGLVLVTGPLQAEFLYVSNVHGNSISAFHIRKNGALRPSPDRLSLLRGAPPP